MASGKKFTIIGASVLLLVAVVAAVGVVISHRSSSSNDAPSGHPDSTGELSTSVKAIKSICQPTDYQETCESTLKSAAVNTTDPKELIKVAFNITIEHVREVFKHSTVLSEAAKDPRTSDALQNCRELLDYATDDLRASFEKLGGLEMTQLDKAVDDLKIWLSAAITYQETCLDGFENTTTDAGESMRKAMNSSAELTSNALAMINEISSILGSFQIPSGLFSRRLLTEEEAAAETDSFPSWVSEGRRRLLALSAAEIRPDLKVAKDGSGDFSTINQALAVVPKNSNTTFVIHIKEGVYKEQVQVNRSMTNVMMIGDGSSKTKITGSLNYIDGTGTFKTAPFAVIGDGFIAKDMWFENSAGPEKHQAVAIRVQSDRSVFYNCRMDGYQDTLYAHTKRQFYRECTISGTVDFIFGDAASIFQNCLIIVRKPLPNQQNIVTAQGRKDRQSATAIILHNCTITGDPLYVPVQAKNPTYLGRPWKEFSRTFILQSQLDSLVTPQGWLPWVGDFGLNTCFYTELDNRGPGADTSKRATWKGVKKIDYQHAQKFTVEHFIQGNQWLPKTGVPFIPGLLPMSEAGRIH